jgi:hypothetical protein
MKNFKKFVVSAAIIGVLGTAGTAYAANIKTPAEITANLTGKTISAVFQERLSGKTYGTIANESGKLSEFQSQMLEQKKAILDSKVKDGLLTQQQADEIYSRIKNNIAVCDGTGSGQMGRNYGLGVNGFSNGRGQGLGRHGHGNGNGICLSVGTGTGVNP